MNISRSIFNEAIHENLLDFEHECRHKYKVDSIVVITMKPIMNKLKEMFKIRDDVGIIHPSMMLFLIMSFLKG